MRFLEVRRFRTFARAAMLPELLSAVLLLSGCATLPSSGPTGHEITRSALDPHAAAPIEIVEVSDLAAIPVDPLPVPAAVSGRPSPPTDMIGPGDVLDIAIYEAGVTLFGGARATAGDAGGFDPSAKVEKLPPARVDDAGNIQIPYGGRLHVAGSTLGAVERMIRQSLRGMSQNPQVLVAMRDVITNSIIVGGEVGKPGRLVLPTNRETLSDAIALSGGYRGDAKDLAVRVARRDGDLEFRLSDVLNSPQRDILLYPGDRIAVLRAPRSFSVMGAPGRVEQLPFSATSISLAEAIATAGGSNPNFGDPKAIFIFRIVTGADARERYVVYHVDMMKAGSYFLAQRFAMRDKDVLYFGNARANQPSKLVQIISQLFSPLVTVATGVQALK